MSADPSKSVFISYRRSISSFIARAIYQDLRFNAYDVFMDVQSIDSGEFDAIILRQIEARGHFLIICSPGTFDRCDEPDDWLRREIEQAIDTKRNIVPIIVNDFKFDDSVMKHLTGKLVKLPRHNGLSVPHDYFEEAMERLRKRYLKQPVIGEIVAPPVADEPLIVTKQVVLDNQPPPTPEQLLAEEHLWAGVSKFEVGDYDGAIEEYNKAIRLNPVFVAAYHNRGLAYKHIQEIERAIEDYTEAIRLDPTYALAYINRGSAYSTLDKLDLAEIDLSEAIRLKFSSVFAYYNRGSVRSKKNDFDGAISDFTEALTISSDWFLLSLIHHDRAQVYILKGEFDAAILDCNYTIENNESIISAYELRSYAKLEKHDFRGALDDATHVINIGYARASIYQIRAEAYAKTGQYAVAIADYKKYLELGGGELNDNQGEIEGKIQDLRRKLDKQ